MGFSAIIFDCDGVLVDSEVIYTAVEREHLAGVGLEYEAAEYMRRLMGLSSADYLAELDRDHRRVKGRALPADFGPSLHAACIARMKTDLRIIEGIDEVIAGFEGPMAVASSSAPDSLDLKLDITGLRPHFDPHIYHAGQVENGKPAPDLFLMAARRLGADPSGCLIIEDSVNGVKAGLAAGMTVWGFSGGGHVGDDHAQRLGDAGAHAVFSDHRQVRARL